MTDEQRIQQLQEQLLEVQLRQLQQDITDHETRLRALEETATRLNTLTALVFGGGVLSAINLVTLIVQLSAR